MSREALRQWACCIGEWHLPRWQELPPLELYMDQVVAFLETQLSKLWLPGEKFITPAMINNYVKLGILPKPIKKKYGRPHLARLMVITLSKQIMPLNDIKNALELALLQHDAAEIYDAFCEQQEQALAMAAASLFGREEERWQQLLHLATQATASGLAAKGLVSMWQDGDQITELKE